MSSEQSTDEHPHLDALERGLGLLTIAAIIGVFLRAVWVVYTPTLAQVVLSVAAVMAVGLASLAIGHGWN